jgi:hypothetical protein
MYFWKAWHDCRTRVVVYILAAVSVGLLQGLDVLSAANMHTVFWTLHRAVRFRYSYDFRMDITLSAMSWAYLGWRRGWPYLFVLMGNWSMGIGPAAALLAGLGLGATSVGREYGAGTMNFVLTRPEARRNFILADWTVGLTGMVVMLGGMAFPILPFLVAVQAKGAGNVLGVLPALWALGAAIYGLAQLTTLVGGSAPRGLILSVATVTTYLFLPNALHDWWHVSGLYRVYEWTMRPFEFGAWPLDTFDWGPVGFWLAVAAVFMGASMAWIRWREV